MSRDALGLLLFFAFLFIAAYALGVWTRPAKKAEEREAERPPTIIPDFTDDDPDDPRNRDDA